MATRGLFLASPRTITPASIDQFEETALGVGEAWRGSVMRTSSCLPPIRRHDLAAVRDADLPNDVQPEPQVTAPPLAARVRPRVVTPLCLGQTAVR